MHGHGRGGFDKVLEYLEGGGFDGWQVLDDICRRCRVTCV